MIHDSFLEAQNSDTTKTPNHRVCEGGVGEHVSEPVLIANPPSMAGVYL